MDNLCPPPHPHPHPTHRHTHTHVLQRQTHPWREYLPFLHSSLSRYRPGRSVHHSAPLAHTSSIGSRRIHWILESHKQSMYFKSNYISYAYMKTPQKPEALIMVIIPCVQLLHTHAKLLGSHKLSDTVITAWSVNDLTYDTFDYVNVFQNWNYHIGPSSTMQT